MLKAVIYHKNSFYTSLIERDFRERGYFISLSKFDSMQHELKINL